MAESIIVALISAATSTIGAILVFITADKNRKQKEQEERNKAAQEHIRMFEETKDAINHTLAQHRTEYLSKIDDVEESIGSIEESIANMKGIYQQTIAVVDLKIDALEKAQNKHNNLMERTYILERDTAIQEEQLKVANHRIEDLEEKVKYM